MLNEYWQRVLHKKFHIGWVFLGLGGLIALCILGIMNSV